MARVSFRRRLPLLVAVVAVPMAVVATNAQQPAFRSGIDVVSLNVTVAQAQHYVTDLVAGSGLAFEDRGSHSLKGPPEPLRLFRAAV